MKYEKPDFTVKTIEIKDNIATMEEWMEEDAGISDSSLNSFYVISCF